MALSSKKDEAAKERKSPEMQNLLHDLKGYLMMGLLMSLGSKMSERLHTLSRPCTRDWLPSEPSPAP